MTVHISGKFQKYALLFLSQFWCFVNALPRTAVFAVLQLFRVIQDQDKKNVEVV